MVVLYHTSFHNIQYHYNWPGPPPHPQLDRFIRGHADDGTTIHITTTGTTTVAVVTPATDRGILTVDTATAHRENKRRQKALGGQNS